jgi:phosphoribosylformylglycinamidine synthase
LRSLSLSAIAFFVQGTNQIDPAARNDASTSNIYYYDPTVRSMLFRAEITIKLKNGMLDPEAATIKNALKHLGYECRSVKQAAIFKLEFEADSRQNATDVAEGMCRRLLANPIIHDYEIELV